jgi:6-phosphogluconolactonase
MKPEIQIVDNAEALYRAGAAEFVRQAGAAVGVKGVFTVALSGGSTPKGLYGLLATDPTLRAQVPWDRTHVFWGDERHVPPTDADSIPHGARGHALESAHPARSCTSDQERASGRSPGG